MIKRILATFLMSTALLLSPASYADQQGEIAFHFYGALDCPPCMLFKKKHLSDVRKQGELSGFAVYENLVSKTADVDKPGVYGATDALLRKAGNDLRRIYPPVFFVTQGDEVVAAYLGNWQKAVQSAMEYSAL